MWAGCWALDMPLNQNGQPEPQDIPLSPEGKRAWVRFYNEHACEQAEMAGDLAAAWSKLEGYAARFALLVHLVRAESGDQTLINAGAVDEQSIAAGVKLSRWFGDEAARVLRRDRRRPGESQGPGAAGVAADRPGPRRGDHRPRFDAGEPARTVRVRKRRRRR